MPFSEQPEIVANTLENLFRDAYRLANLVLQDLHVTPFVHMSRLYNLTWQDLLFHIPCAPQQVG